MRVAIGSVEHFAMVSAGPHQDGASQASSVTIQPVGADGGAHYQG
jgi:hypothetical protein